MLCPPYQSDSVTNLRKAQAAYLNRQQEYEKAKGDTLKAEGDKVEKRRKAEEEASHKVHILSHRRICTHMDGHTYTHKRQTKGCLGNVLFM